MRLFGRGWSAYRRGLSHPANVVRQLVRCGRLFRRPWRVVGLYLGRTAAPGTCAVLRDGVRLFLSGDHDDVATLMGVFVREDYGRIAAGATVLDVGANIGAFAVFAARSGAARVVAIEPSAEAFECLTRTVLANGLARVIVPRRLAVAGEAGPAVRFPLRASVRNRVMTDASSEPFAWVDTTTLAELVAEIGPVDVLKLDCEGAEYEILLMAAPPVLEQINEIRMEYHAGRTGELSTHLAANGFRLVHTEPETEQVGSLWFRREVGAARATAAVRA